MTKKTISQFRGLGIQEIEEKLAGLRMKLGKERSSQSSGTRPEKPATIRKLRKDIARCLTIITEKKQKIKGGKGK